MTAMTKQNLLDEDTSTVNVHCCYSSRLFFWRITEETIVPVFLGVAHLFPRLRGPAEGRIKDFFVCLPPPCRNRPSRLPARWSAESTDQTANIWCKRFACSRAFQDRSTRSRLHILPFFFYCTGNPHARFIPWLFLWNWLLLNYVAMARILDPVSKRCRCVQAFKMPKLEQQSDAVVWNHLLKQYFSTGEVSEPTFFPTSLSWSRDSEHITFYHA